MQAYLLFIGLLFCSLFVKATDYTQGNYPFDGLFSPAALIKAEQRLDSLDKNTDYQLGIFLNASLDPIKQKHERNLEKWMSKAERKAQKGFSEIKIGKKTNQGILISFHFYITHAMEDNLTEAYFIQNIGFGSGVSNYLKIRLANYKPAGTLRLMQIDKRDNDAYLEDLIDFFIKSIVSDINYKYGGRLDFGPLTVVYDEKNHKETDKNVRFDDENSLKYYEYEIRYADFDIILQDDIVGELKFTVENATVTYFLDNDDKGRYRDVSIMLNNKKEPIGAVSILNAYLNELNITVNNSDEQKVSGEVVFNGLVEEDKFYRELIQFKKGAEGLFTFTIEGQGDGLQGSFDFSGIQGINIYLKKGNKNIAKIRDGSFSQDGVISGILELQEDVNFITPYYTLKILQMDLGCSYSMKDGFSVQQGSARFSLSKIKGLKGTFQLLVTVDDSLKTTSELDQSAKGMVEFFGMELRNISAVLNLNERWELEHFEASGKLKHPGIETEWDLDKLVLDAEGVKELNGSGNIHFDGFEFELANLSYKNDSLSIDANAVFNLSGLNSSYEVSKFMMDTTGTITIGRISGTMKYRDYVNVYFSASYNEARFQGWFNGELVAFELSGGLDIGRAVGDYNFVYFEARLASDKVGIPLPAFPAIHINSLGGKVGYNYTLSKVFRNGENAFEGSPQEHSYAGGFVLGLGDAAKLLGVEGASTFVISDDSVKIFLEGNVTVPSARPFFTGNVMLDYVYPANYLAGSVNTAVKVPKSNGAIISTENLGFDFELDPYKWYVGKDNFNIKLLSFINFDGSFDFNGTFREDPGISGIMNGKFGFDFGYEVNQQIDILGIEAVSVDAAVSFSIQQYASLQFDESSFTGTIGLEADGAATMTASFFNDLVSFDASAAFSIDASGTLTEKDLSANGSVILTMSDDEDTDTYDFSFNEHITHASIQEFFVSNKLN